VKLDQGCFFNQWLIRKCSKLRPQQDRFDGKIIIEKTEKGKKSMSMDHEFIAVQSLLSMFQAFTDASLKSFSLNIFCFMHSLRPWLDSNPRLAESEAGLLSYKFPNIRNFT
jgi:hypothetical protein